MGKAAFQLKHGITGLFTACVFSASSAGANDKIELVFTNHLAADFVEQHVYIEREPGSGQIYRVTPPEVHRYADSPVFAAAEVTENAPLDHAETGPYDRGKALGFTLGDWLAGSGTGTYECDDGIGRLNIGFENLVPNAVYTMWYSLVPRPALDPFAVLDIPVGSRDGSDSPFSTDGRGRAEYDVRFTPCLQLSGIQVDAMVAIAWHSDGKTYGASPGPFSTVTHVQLFAGLPLEE